MDHAMAEIVKVNTFRGDVGCDQQANFGFITSKILNNTLLLDIGHCPMQNVDLFGFEFQILFEVFPQEAQGLNSLGENYDTISSVTAIPSPSGMWIPYQGNELLIFFKIGWPDSLYID